jgi:hypothetical protein
MGHGRASNNKNRNAKSGVILEEKIKACYLAFLKRDDMTSVDAAVDELKRIHTSINLARELRNYHNISVGDGIIKDQYSVRDANNLVQTYRIDNK